MLQLHLIGDVVECHCCTNLIKDSPVLSFQRLLSAIVMDGLYLSLVCDVWVGAVMWKRELEFMVDLGKNIKYRILKKLKRINLGLAMQVNILTHSHTKHSKDLMANYHAKVSHRNNFRQSISNPRVSYKVIYKKIYMHNTRRNQELK